MFRPSFIFCIALSATAAAYAADPQPPVGSVIAAVQSPAWLVHGTVTTPIKPGLTVGDGDTLRTGAGGRVYVDLPEHSRVKLGENTEFQTPAMDMMKDPQGSMFKGVLHILKGVFRFTTSLIGKSERREVNIQVGVATIGIRGTDVWGRAGTDGSLVALLEGKAQMDMPGHATMMMDQPMHYNMMPAAGEMQMNQTVTPANVADWAAQTDVAEGKGVLSADGRWTVSLASSTNPAETERMIKQLADAGYPAEETTATVKGREWHRLVIMKAATHQDALAIAASLSKQYPFMSPWVLPPSKQ